MAEQYDHMQGEETDHSDHEESVTPANQMLRDRANRGQNADNIQQNRNSDLRNRALRGTFNTIKAMREAP